MDKPSSSKNSSRRQRSPIDDLIKCFCDGCEKIFKRKHVEKALKANQQEILEDAKLRAILKKFLEYTSKKRASNIKLTEMKIVECYELAGSILSGRAEISECQTDLEELCFTPAWEDRLTAAVDEDSEVSLGDFLNDLMLECSRRLGQQESFIKEFKQELQRKLNH